MATNRSPNYPSVSLGDAIELARRLHDKEKQSPAAPGDVVRAWGYSGLSGPSRTKLSAVRKYGLIEETGRGMRLTDRAMAILFPNDPEEGVAALRAAAVEPELFRELASYEGASDDNLVSRLVRTGFTQAGARAAVASYRETMTIVPGEANGYDASHDGAGPQPVTSTSAINRPTTFAYAGAASGVGAASDPAIAFAMRIGESSVEFRVTDGALTKDGIALLRSYLDLVEKSVSLTKAEAPIPASPSPDANEPEQPAALSLIVRED